MGPSNNHNHPGLDWVVQKFGGTSIGKYAFQANRVAKRRDSLRRNRVAVVCSARSTTSKAAGTTTRLIEIFNVFDAARVGNGRQQADAVGALQSSLQIIVEEHLVGAAPSLVNKASRDILAARLSLEAQNTVSAVTEALKAPKYDHGWVQDLLVSLGEKLSCLTMVAILQDLGVEAEYVDLSSILPPSSPSTPVHDDANCYTSLSAAIGARLSSCGPRVPVATGFFGPSSGGMLASTVGRGYTDLCAALAAVGLAAVELQVWKEVDGILTADPSRVPGARLVPRGARPGRPAGRGGTYGDGAARVQREAAGGAGHGGPAGGRRKQGGGQRLGHGRRVSQVRRRRGVPGDHG
ncbi:aspartokinase [Cordyceps fumosorosea ARSEF 2679]|uniref:Aspartokinase n=1 Tax=Cordyceps fumosorosea (strain ARSEF 2679) TaxID=1081104 RepID=A0A167R218_CORFA|nr:aspartokinase [Cordyceps fumosorosea ARSEF 2679]OAA58197.1 aspartokinase [Cordyceps fumosorosea ARSEF 2679]